MEIIKRKYVKKISRSYKEILDKESHHDHEIVRINDVIRWKANEKIKPHINIGETINLFYMLGYNKNSEIYRKFYRDLGYSLSGYWETFYWKVNNQIADEYKPSLLKKIIYKFRDIYKKRKK